MLKSSGQVKGPEERSLTPADLVFHFVPIESYLWLKQHDLKAEKGNLCPVILMGLGSARQQPCGLLRQTVALFRWQRENLPN